MEEDWRSCHIISLIPEREASTEYKPCEPGKIVRRTVQDCTLSLVCFYKTYFVLVILQRFAFTQLEMGLRSRAPLHSHL
jgi:hypothetical protein